MFLMVTSQGRGHTDICFFSTSGTQVEYGISDEGSAEGEQAPSESAGNFLCVSEALSGLTGPPITHKYTNTHTHTGSSWS